MNREQLIRDVVRKSWAPRKEAEEALEAVVDGIAHGLRQGRAVPLPGIGVFRMRRAPKNSGRSRPRRVVVFTRFRKPRG